MNKKLNLENSTIMLAVLAVLTAACTVISMFLTIKTSFINITFTFIPIAIAARLYGPAGGGTVAGLSDIIGVIVKPVGAWFPPITITSIIVGILFGLFFSGKYDFRKIIIAILISELIISTFVTPIWLNMLYGTDYPTLLITRIPQILIMTAVKIILIPVSFKALERAKIFHSQNLKKEE